MRLHAESRSLAVRRIIAVTVAALALATTPHVGAQSSAGDWAWMGGSSTAISCPTLPCPAQAGIYGTEFQFADANLPGYRYGAATWTGADGKLWMFGGYGYDKAGNFSLLDDLWAFDPGAGAHGQWAWMGGTTTSGSTNLGQYGIQYQPADANLPGGRSVPGTWTDANGRLWLFGGVGLDSLGTTGLLNDLWVFDPALGAHGQWAWISGGKTIPDWTYSGNFGVYGTKYVFDPANTPGGRNVPITWTDASGRMWLYSGTGYNAGGQWVDLVDWWVFDPAQGAHGEWAWMGGPNVGPVNFSNPGVYGSEFQFAPGNTPSYHQAVAHWDDGKGNLWLFGGWGSDSAGTLAPLNELWTFNPSQGANGEWAWMDGDSTITDMGAVGNYPGQRGIFGPEYRFADANSPGARALTGHWTDAHGRLWMLGGSGVARHGAHGLLNDLWVFDPAQGSHGQWAWMGGSDTLRCDMNGVCYGRTGIYGTEYTFNTANAPGGRGVGQTWTDKNGNLWMFCGTGYDSAGTNGNLRDMWEFRFFTPQSISFQPLPATITYGAAPITLAATATSGLPVSYTVTGPGKLTGPNTLAITGAGTGLTITASQPGDATFGPAQVHQSVWVYKAPLTVAADNITITYGSAIPPLTWSAAGFVNGDAASSALTGAPALSTIATSTSAPGIYPVAISRNTLSATNYLVALKWGTITIQPLGTVIKPTFTLPTGTYTGSRKIAIKDATAGATIYYTTDGSTPSATHGTRYTGAITVSTSATMNAVAVKKGYTSSPIASATYTIQ